MGLITHHNNVVVGVDGIRFGVVEFLDQREDKGGIAFQLRYQVFPATGDKFLGFYIA